jgi:hypothetical protein
MKLPVAPHEMQSLTSLTVKRKFFKTNPALPGKGVHGQLGL